jgi:hypothetical protein
MSGTEKGPVGDKFSEIIYNEAMQDAIWPEIYRIYERHDLDPLSYSMPVLDQRHFLDIDYYRQQIKKHQTSVTEISEMISERYGSNSQEAKLCQIIAQITSPVDQIFLDQVNQTNQGKKAIGYRKLNPSAVSEINQHLDDVQKQTSAIICPENLAILAILKTALGVSNPDEILSYIKKAEQIALSLSLRGVPTVLFSGDVFYSNHEANQRNRFGIEIDTRLLLPRFNLKSFAISKIEQATWKYLTDLHGNPPGIDVPKGLIGFYLMGAGSQLVAATTAERFYSNGYTISVNLFKSLPIIQKFITRRGLTTPDNLEIYPLLINLVHEQGHTFLDNPKFEEIDADSSAMAGLFVLSRQLGLDPEIMAISILGEYYMQTVNAFSGHVVLDSYKQSGVIVIKQMFQQGLVSISDGKLSTQMNPSNLGKFCQSMMDLHTSIHQGDFRFNNQDNNIGETLKQLKFLATSS